MNKDFALLEGRQRCAKLERTRTVSDLVPREMISTFVDVSENRNGANHNHDFRVNRSVFTEATLIPIPIKVQLVRLVPSTRRRTAILIRKL